MEEETKQNHGTPRECLVPLHRLVFVLLPVGGGLVALETRHEPQLFQHQRLGPLERVLPRDGGNLGSRDDAATDTIPHFGSLGVGVLLRQ